MSVTQICIFMTLALVFFKKEKYCGSTRQEYPGT